MEALEWFRLLNIFIAGIALLINAAKAWHFKFFKYMNADATMGFLALMSWCLSYTIAASLATLEDVTTGIWTVIMGLPCWWSLAAGVMGWNRTMNDKDLVYMKLGALSPNEIRRRRGLPEYKEKE